MSLTTEPLRGFNAATATEVVFTAFLAANL